MAGRPRRRAKFPVRVLSKLQESGLFVVFALFGLLIVTLGVRAWTIPGQNPPGGNVAAPLNSGATSQTKSGSFISSATVGGNTLNASSSLCISGDCKTAWSQVGPTSTVPVGLIGFFAGACPSGWSEYTTLRGRFLVGTPSSGTDAGTVGNALANLGSVTVSQVAAHTHSVDPPSTSVSVTDPGHNHTQNAHNHGVTDPGHTHPMPLGDGGSGASIGAYPGQSNNLGTQDTNSNTTGLSVNNTTPTNNANTTGISASVNISAFDSAATGTASVNVTMPYIQLRACQKT